MKEYFKEFMHELFDLIKTWVITTIKLGWLLFMLYFAFIMLLLVGGMVIYFLGNIVGLI